MDSYKTILFDLNGVFILDKENYKASPLEHTIFKRLGLSLKDSSEKEKIKKELNWTEKDFWKFVETSWGGAIPNLWLIDVIKNLKEQGYETGIVSNTSGLIMRQVLQNYFGEDLNTLFGAIIIYSEVGCLKPEQEIYRIAIERLKTEPHQTIMIDDAEEYLTGAKNLGITPILFVTNEQLEKDLKHLGIIKVT